MVYPCNSRLQGGMEVSCGDSADLLGPYHPRWQQVSVLYVWGTDSFGFEDLGKISWCVMTALLNIHVILVSLLLSILDWPKGGSGNITANCS